MPKKLSIVVHGIGEQVPGATLDGLVGTATGNKAHVVHSEQRWLRDERQDTNTRDVKLFPCHMRRVSQAGSEVVFAEVFWADLSRGREGRFATLYELVLVVLGLSHIVRENAEVAHSGRHWSRSLADWFIATLHGPIAGLNLMLLGGALLLFGLYLVGGKVCPDQYIVFERTLPAELVAHVAMGLLGVAAIVVGYVSEKRTTRYLVLMFARWLMLLGILFLMVVAATWLFDLNERIRFFPWLDGARQPLYWYGVTLMGALNLVWFTMLILVGVLLVGQALTGTQRDNGNPDSIFPDVSAVMVVLWLVITSTFWATAAKVMGDEVINGRLLQNGTGLMAGTWMSASLIIVLGALVWWKRKRWTKAHDTSNCGDSQAPRLIFNPVVRWAFAFSLLFLCVSAVSLLCSRFQCQIGPFNWLSDLLREGYAIALTIAGLVGALYLAIWPKVAVVLGVAKDVITYFIGNPGSGRSEQTEFPLRQRIEQRFLTVLETMIASETPDEVTVIAHSQGTVIAIEALRSTDASVLYTTPSITRRTLVTMGSPYSHLYEHYFSTKFRLPTTSDLRLDRWINIFRIDDFVGTHLGDVDGQWPENVAVNAKGHTGYWTDDEVRDVLVSSVLPELA